MNSSKKLETRLRNLINEDNFKSKVFRDNCICENSYIELVDCFEENGKILIYLIVSNKGFIGQTGNIIALLLSESEGEFSVIEGNLDVQMQVYAILHMDAHMYLGSEEKKICIELMYRLKILQDTDRLLVRLNNGLELSNVIIGEKTVNFQAIDVLRNGYYIYCPEIYANGDIITLSCKIEGKPILRFGNYLRNATGCIWSESMIFPCTNYLPKDKYTYKLTIEHSENTKLVASYYNEEYVDTNRIRTTIRSNIPIGAPLIMYGNYNEWCFDVIESQYSIRIFAKMAKESDIVQKLKQNIIDILTFYYICFGNIPFSNICFVYDTTYAISCNQGDTIILNNDIIPLLAHEIAHLWWGSCVTIEGEGSSWVHESFADLFKLLFIYELDLEKICSKFHVNRKIKKDELLYNNVFGNKGSISRQGIALLLRIVKRNGVLNFLQQCRSFVVKYKFKVATLELVERNFEFNFDEEYARMVKKRF